MLHHEARDIGIVAGQHELREHAAHCLHRTDQVFQHIGVVNADLEHHAAGHTLGGIPPRPEIDLADAIAADVRLCIDELSERARVDPFPDPSELALAATLIADREHDARLAADGGDRSSVGDGIGDRLVEKHVLAGTRRSTRCFEMHVVRRRVDDRLDRVVAQNRLVTRCRPATVLGGESLAFFVRARVAGSDPQLARTLDRIREHVRPPAHADARDRQRVSGRASLRTDGRDGFARDSFVELEIATADAYPADAFAVDEDGATALHSGPPIYTGGEREADCMHRIERLRLRALRRGRPLVGGGADSLCRGRVHGVKTPTVHALD